MKKIPLLICVLIAGCSGKPKEQYCPSLSIVPDGSFIIKYEEGTKNIFSQASITNAQGYCSFKDDALTLGGSFDLNAMLGEKAQEVINVPFEYFIAVLDENNNILQKEIYTQNVKFKKNKDFKNEYIKVKQTLPLNSDAELYKYNVLLSFQLTEEELENNRNRSNPY